MCMYHNTSLCAHDAKVTLFFFAADCMSQTLQLRKFDPATIGDGRICVIIAKRGSGK